MQFGPEITIGEEQIIVETKFSFVFVNIRPFLKYHVLVAPKRVSKYLVELSEEEYLDLWQTVKQTIKSMSFFATDFSVTVQDGSFAGQTVPHVHVHIIPRLEDDLPENNMIYQKGALETNIDDEGKIRKNRTAEEMKV